MKDTESSHPEQQPIALLVSSLSAGGAERVALNLSEEFRLRGHRVDLLVVNRSGPLLGQVPSGVRVVDLESLRARGAIGAFRRYVRMENPAAIISIAFQANLLALATTMGLSQKPKLILTVHSTLSRAFRGHAIRRWTLTAATRLLYRRADAVVAVSRGAASDLNVLGVATRRLVTIHNPVIRLDFEQMAQAVADHPWFASRQDPVVLTVGRLTEAKHHRLLLAAFQRLQREASARLIIVGDGELRAALEAEASKLGVAECVSFAGHVQNPYPYMREADLFVLSSAWEGFGNVLVEAMATGTPVVSTDCPHGPREILEDGKWGSLVPVGDVDALAKAMLKVLAEGGVDARERANEFTVAAAADKYLALLSGTKSRPAELA